MRIRELIEKLGEYNPEARVDVVVHNMSEEFSIAFGGMEGDTKETTESVSFYVDRLCNSEQEAGEPIE